MSDPKPRCPTCGQEIEVLPPDVEALLNQISRDEAEDDMCGPWRN